jgi:peptide/nickel transport system permease protein
MVTRFFTIDALIAGRFDIFVDALKHLIMPGCALAMGAVAQESRITRSGIVENLRKDYITSAVSHGIPEKVITFKYLLKPSLIPTITIMALDIAVMVGGAFLIETIFNWPGFSRYGTTAILRKDLNAIVAVVLVIGIIFALANIIADLIVNYLDPRIRLIQKAE